MHIPAAPKRPMVKLPEDPNSPNPEAGVLVFSERAAVPEVADPRIGKLEIRRRPMAIIGKPANTVCTVTDVLGVASSSI